MAEKINISNLGEDKGQGVPLLSVKKDIVKRKDFLANKTIGISISESENLNELGYGISHLKDAMIEIARYIFALGGKTAYGGDMRNGGFTESFFELLAYYKSETDLPQQRFFSYLFWPRSLSLSKEKEADLIHTVSFKRIAPPNDLNIKDVNQFLPSDTKENAYVWARCLTKMRKEMQLNCNARIFMGGSLTGFKGICPGVLEELLLALEDKQPIYLIGAFGGVSLSAINALEGKKSDCFSLAFYSENSQYQKFIDLYNARHFGKPINYEKYFNALVSLKPEGLSELNGLSIEDNRRLSITPHIHEIVYLIIKGLTKKFAA
jgi:hypothetical protein